MLWKKVMRGLSAGRVQSVATRLVVQRERERMAFRSAEYWDLLATFDPGSFEARLVSRGRHAGRAREGLRPDDRRAARERCRAPRRGGRPRSLAGRLEGASFAVRSVEERPYRRKPAAPFRTATLQQEASRKLRFSAQTTMRVAQRLYESGYITYMRTDSTTLSESAVEAARSQGRRALRRGLRPREATALRTRGGERPGGARGDPARRRHRSGRRRSSERARPRRARAVRPRLEANARLADGGRARQDRLAANRRDELRRRGRRVRRVGHGDHVPRVPRRVRAGQGRADGRRRGARPAAALQVGQDVALVDAGAGRPHDAAPRPLHGADARPGARGARHRAAVDVRGDPLDDPRPRLRLQEGHRARPDVPRLRRRAICSSSTSSSSSTSTSPPAWRTTSTGSPPATRSASSGSGASTSATARPRPSPPRHRAPRRDRRTRGQLDRDPRDPTSVVRVGRYGPYLESGEQRASLPPDLAPDELTPEKARGAPLAAGQPAARQSIPRRGQRDRRPLGPLRAVRDRGARRRAPTRSRGRRRSSRRCPPRRSRSRRRSGSSRSRASSATSTARR